MGKKILLFILTFSTVVILGAGSYAFNIVTSTSASIYEDVGKSGKYTERLESINLEEGDPISILVMGVDTRKGQKTGRSDSLILLTINPKTNSTHMTSIPRDTYTEIKGAKNKINSSSRVGGTELTMASVERLLDVPVDYFFKVNFQGFEDIVDAIGGVKVTNELEFNTEHAEFTKENFYFPEGEIHLNGKEALVYARMRKMDPRGDFGRQERQRQLIEAVLHKGASISSILKLGEITDVIENNVKTNMPLRDMWDIQSGYKEAAENIKQHTIEGTDRTINGTYYFMPDQEKLDKISNTLKDHLGIGKADEPTETKESDKESTDDFRDSTNQESVKENKDTEIEKQEKSDGSTADSKPYKESDTSEQNSDTSEQNDEKSVKKQEARENEEIHSHPIPPEKEDEDKEDKAVKDSNKTNGKKVITKNWSPVPTKQENHTRVTFDEGSLDWRELSEAISKGAGLAKQDMILWWVAGAGRNSVIATVTNKAQTENYRVYVSWVEGAGYAPTKVEVLYENDQKYRSSTE